MIKTNCFAYKETDCSVLKKLYCKKGTCRFFKTKDQYRKDKEKYEVADGTLREDGQLTVQLSIESLKECNVS